MATHATPDQPADPASNPQGNLLPLEVDNLAPIGEHPQRVLDVGTRTGGWAIDFADQYPSAVVNTILYLENSWH
jgi:hypothetical protein